MDVSLPPQLQSLAEQPLSRTVADSVDYYFGDQLSARFDPAMAAVWLTMQGLPRPCFNAGLLEAFKGAFSMLERSGGRLEHKGELKPFHYTVLRSSVPGIFNLGGDLNLFKELIETRNLAEMRHYAYLCIEPLYRHYQAYRIPCMTISLVQGQALGGGFETVLSSDLVVAERSSKFGFPEIMFGLFPGMGATSFLSRKVGEKTMDRLMCTGEVISAEQAAELGVVDVVCDDGDGEAAVANLIRKRRNQVHGYMAMAMAKRRARNCTLQELTDITDLWADTAMNLSSMNLKLMARLVAKQNDMVERHSEQKLAA